MDQCPWTESILALDKHFFCFDTLLQEYSNDIGVKLQVTDICKLFQTEILFFVRISLKYFDHVCSFTM